MMIKELTWEERDGGLWLEATGLPLWREGRYPQGVRWVLWIEPRPAHCDRGRWKLSCDAPIDYQEGFPRYYFSLNVAKAEALAWVNVREELKHADS